MNVQEILTQVDHIITEVDLELYEWQEGLDMMSFAGLEVPLVWVVDGAETEIGTVRLIHDDGALRTSSTAFISEEHKDHLVVTNPSLVSFTYDPGPPARMLAKPVPSLSTIKLAGSPKAPENRQYRGWSVEDFRNFHIKAGLQSDMEFLENHPFFRGPNE